MTMDNLYSEIIREIDCNNNKLLITQWTENIGEIDNNNYSKKLIKYIDEIANETLKEQARDTLLSGKPRLVKDTKNTKYTLIEPFYPRERLIIFGGGHIALPLVDFSAKVGFSVVVVDDRPSFASKARFPLASQVLCQGFDDIFHSIKLTSNDYIVIITRGHRHDAVCLRQILEQEETVYLGMIGSKRRVGGMKEMLAEEGYDLDRINRICTPIGLSIGAVTPEEISISILSEIIKRKRLDKLVNYVANRSDLDMEVIEKLAMNQEPCSIVTVIDTKGSVPRGVGAKMIVYPTGQVLGSIGGGCSEGAVIQNAVRIIGTKRYMTQIIDMTGDVAESEGMVCGGVMEVLIEDFYEN
jgi:xanthine dehydrogenase accessory factor